MGSEQLTRRRLLAAATGVAAGVAGCNTPRSGTSESGNVSNPAATELLNTTPESQSVYTDVYRRTIDSVVLIRVYADSRGRVGEGSGFVYDDRYIVTNEHVVTDTRGAVLEPGSIFDEIRVQFTGGQWRAAEVVGTDAYSDLAVLDVQSVPDSATPLSLIGGEVAIGQPVIAIGNPLGYTGSMTTGAVSGVDRSLPARNNFRIPDAIQTDAPVNPGNSGGPLVTLDGEVAGVINSGGGDNIGFAISAALMKRVVPSLIETGDYEHSFMGVSLTSVTPSIAEAEGLSDADGVYIDDVRPEGPASGVLQGSTGDTTIDGVRVPTGGDVIVSMGGQPVQSQEVLSTYLALVTSPGDTIPVEVIRDGRRTTVQLTLGERPEPYA
ncbi:S1C family serine protease [Halorientalis pallida]|uniref:PDZ domain-containing protein n=1 Tax=Halorientalis pallida TaxID=2479928 RepID=A0A498L382_9EURY|nr:trypsin-like peptidase domain-containing protein [Halorientalis pallida]RXK51084.1 PDZ domain-containing protein [Halorientalis pallida]